MHLWNVTNAKFSLCKLLIRNIPGDCRSRWNVITDSTLEDWISINWIKRNDARGTTYVSFFQVKFKFLVRVHVGPRGTSGQGRSGGGGHLLVNFGFWLFLPLILFCFSNKRKCCGFCRVSSAATDRVVRRHGIGPVHFLHSNERRKGINKGKTKYTQLEMRPSHTNKSE